MREIGYLQEQEINVLLPYRIISGTTDLLETTMMPDHFLRNRICVLQSLSNRTIRGLSATTVCSVIYPCHAPFYNCAMPLICGSTFGNVPSRRFRLQRHIEAVLQDSRRPDLHLDAFFHQ